MKKIALIGIVVLVGLYGGYMLLGSEKQEEVSAPAQEQEVVNEEAAAPVSEDVSEADVEEEIVEYVAPVPAETEHLVGAWNVQTGNFEYIDVYPDGTFATFLHDKPFMSGVWFYEGGQFTLAADPDEELSESFTNVSRAFETLTLTNDNDEEVSWSLVAPL